MDYKRTGEIALTSTEKTPFNVGRYYEFIYLVKSGDPKQITRATLAAKIAAIPAKNNTCLQLVDWAITQQGNLIVQVQAVGTGKIQLASTEATMLALPLVSVAWAIAAVVAVIVAYKVVVEIKYIYELTPLPARSVAAVAGSFTLPLALAAGAGLLLFWPRRPA